MNEGNTLIETLIYIALLSILMIGVFSSVYSIIYLQERKNDRNYSIFLLKQYYE